MEIFIMKLYKLIAASIAILLAVSSCGTKTTANAADATYAYLQALASKDTDAVISLTCKESEEQAILEVDALMSVDAALNDIRCEQTGQDGDEVLVVCTGSLDLTYNNEIRAIELDKRTYSMKMEDGQWRVCSYK
jgi:outer membrane lipoprotein-sorting protein